MGGTVALEMAQQWREEGKEVALVVLMDSDVAYSATPLDDAHLLAWFAKDLGGSSGKSLMIASEDLRTLAPDQRLSFVLEQARAEQVLPQEADIVYLYQLVQVFQANAQALWSYVPQAYPYHTVLLAANETLAEHASDQTLGWGKLIGSALNVFPVPGNHYTIITQPYVKHLAGRLKWCLEEAQMVTH